MLTQDFPAITNAVFRSISTKKISNLVGICIRYVNGKHLTYTHRRLKPSGSFCSAVDA